jgi:hypothetical protein
MLHSNERIIKHKVGSLNLALCQASGLQPHRPQPTDSTKPASDHLSTPPPLCFYSLFVQSGSGGRGTKRLATVHWSARGVTDSGRRRATGNDPFWPFESRRRVSAFRCSYVRLHVLIAVGPYNNSARHHTFCEKYSFDRFAPNDSPLLEGHLT